MHFGSNNVASSYCSRRIFNFDPMGLLLLHCMYAWTDGPTDGWMDGRMYVCVLSHAVLCNDMVDHL